MLIGLANDELGYFIPKRQWDEKAPFCYGLKKAQYGEMNSVGPDAAPVICNTFKELVKRLHPDHNKGDRTSEDKLREVIQAYNYLRQAGLA